MKDWDAAFAVSPNIEGAQNYAPLWQKLASQYRENAEYSELDVPYGTQPREVLDLFWPRATPKGLAVFVHGGYWMAFDKSSWSHLAQGACDAGWAVAIPSYTLAPEARISDITRQIGRAIGEAARRLPGPIRLAGHSAGGHLVTRMICQNTPLASDVAGRVQHVLSISGLHDLRDLRRTKMNEKLRLSAREAIDESPALQPVLAQANVTAWVGGDEGPEFLHQAQLLCDSWSQPGRDINCIIDKGRHHFDVIAPLAVRNSAITAAFIGSP